MTKIITCYHCGNKTLMNIVASYNWIDEDHEHGIWEDCDFKMYMCPICNNMTLERECLFSEDAYFVSCLNLNKDQQQREIEKVTAIDTLYPFQAINSSHIPKAVKDSFESAIKVRNIDGAICAIAIRRTIEMVCKDKGVKEGSLYEMLKSLSDNGILPPILEEMASVLRKIGNAAAHADEKDFDHDLVNSMIEFTKIILDYLYNIPEQLKQVQDSIGEQTRSQ